MTAEIVIMNKYGVALAADSAVSIGSKKVYNSANKLFALSKRHPVGIMIYGNAMFMGIPWETIIKKYRNDHLREGFFDTIHEHANDFLDYLSKSSIISTETEEHFIKLRFHNIAQRLIQSFIEEIRKLFEQTNKPVTETEIGDRLSSWLTEAQAHAKKQESIDNISSKEKSAIKRKYNNIFYELLDKCLERLPVTEKNKRTLFSITCTLLFSKIDLGENSGIVIAGYGADEIFPKTEDITLSGKIGRHLIIEKRSQQKIKIGMGASVAPYAQREMVDTIMKGIDPQLEREVRGLVREALEKLPDMLAQHHGLSADSEIRATISSQVAEVCTELEKQIDMAQRDHYILPVLESVGTLPLAELGAMAEALVSITSFKRRVTMVAESVGGPIDVALISKGDGFVWIKRKHYFDPQLNHQYFINQSRMPDETTAP